MPVVIVHLKSPVDVNPAHWIFIVPGREEPHGAGITGCECVYISSRCGVAHTPVDGLILRLLTVCSAYVLV